jgi:hypothetical protein
MLFLRYINGNFRHLTDEEYNALDEYYTKNPPNWCVKKWLLLFNLFLIPHEEIN